jgi:FHA domain-containing protein
MMIAERCPVCSQEISQDNSRCPTCKTIFSPTIFIPQELRDELAKMSIEVEEIEKAHLLPHTETLQMGEDGTKELKFGTARMKGVLVLTEMRTEKSYYVAIEKLQLAVVGRSNLKGFVPTVDLSDAQGAEYGVSRYHASINLDGDVLSITDQGSTNGTFINGQRLTSGDARIIRNGDIIQLGTMRLRVGYQKESESANADWEN